MAGEGPSGKGLLITFEGGEGAGKSTQLARLARTLRERGHGVVETREPGGSPSAERVRALLLGPSEEPWPALSELFLIEAARAAHLEQTVRPALARGEVVLCDRFTDSTLAYQGYGRGLDLAAVRRANALASDGLVPALTLILDLAPDRGLARAAARGDGNRFEAQPFEFHERLAKGFRAIARREPKRCVLIDAGAPIDAVERAVLSTVAARLGARLGWSSHG